MLATGTYRHVFLAVLTASTILGCAQKSRRSRSSAAVTVSTGVWAHVDVVARPRGQADVVVFLFQESDYKLSPGRCAMPGWQDECWAVPTGRTVFPIGLSWSTRSLNINGQILGLDRGCVFLVAESGAMQIDHDKGTLLPLAELDSSDLAGSLKNAVATLRRKHVVIESFCTDPGSVRMSGIPGTPLAP